MKKTLFAFICILLFCTASYSTVTFEEGPKNTLYVWKARNIQTKAYITSNGQPYDLSGVTKVVVNFYNGSSYEYYDSVTCPSCFTIYENTSHIGLDIGLKDWTTTTDTTAELIIYDTSNTYGFVAGTFKMIVVDDTVGSAELVSPFAYTPTEAWQVFYSNADGNVTQLPMDEAGYLKINVSAAPTIEIPAGTGDMVEANYDTEAEFENRLFEITTPGELDYFTNADETDQTVDTSAEIQAIIGAEVYQPYGANVDTDYTDDLALGELSTNAYRGDRGKTAYDHSQASHAPAGAEENPALMSQAEAEAGTDENERVVSALRIAQAIAAQAGSGSGDVSAASNLTNDAIVAGDGGAKGVQTKPVTISDLGVIAVNGEYTLPNADGTNGQVLKTDGSGAVTFQADDTGTDTLDDVTDDNVESMTTAGATGTVPMSDGAGNLSMASVLSPTGDGSGLTNMDTNTSIDTLYIPVRNTTGSTISTGKWVYLTGATAQKATIALADNSAVSSSKVVGYVYTDIENLANGYVVLKGHIEHQNTGAFTDGAALYLGTNGDAVTTQPVDAVSVYLGSVVYANAGAGLINVAPEPPGIGVIEAYDAVGWDGDDGLATKNDISDKVETMQSAIDLNTAKPSYYNCTIPQPGIQYDNSIYIPLDVYTESAITITDIDISCDSASYELDWDLMYADALIGMANATVAQAIDTTSGVLSLSGQSIAIGQGKAVYIRLNADPNSAIKWVSFKAKY